MTAVSVLSTNVVTDGYLYAADKKESQESSQNNGQDSKVHYVKNVIKVSAKKPEPKNVGRIEVSGTDFVVDGKKIYLNGVNTPWDNWNDFGGDFDVKFWKEHFALLKESGINACRVWISCNGDVGIDIDDKGYVSGATGSHWSNVDKLFQIADENGIYIMATLMSFDHFKNTYNNYEKWRKMVKSDSNVDSYINNYVIPFCKKYDKYDSLFSIDLCNEPDWVYENDESGKIDWSILCKLFAKEAAAIHENSDILVTIGFAMTKYNSDKYEGNHGSDKYLQSLYNNKNAYLDYYSPHFYEWEATWFNFPFDKSPVSFGVEDGKPAVVGEFPATGMTDKTEGSKNMDGSECYVGLYNNGWNGAFAWTSNGVDSCGSLDDFAKGAKKVYDSGLVK